MALNKYQQFIKEIKDLYTKSQKMEAVELMRFFFRNYNNNNPEIKACLLELLAYSNKWIKDNSAEAFNINTYLNWRYRDYDAAIASGVEAIKLSPQYVNAYHNLGNIYLELENYPSAIQHYKKAIELDETYVDSYNGLGNVYNHLNDYLNAIKEYEKVIELDEKYAIVYGNFGYLYAKLKDYPKAIEKYQKAIDLDKNDAFAHNGLGIVYSRLNDYQEAIKSYEKAIKSDENFASAYFNLASTYEKQNEYQNALLHYNKYIQIQKDKNDIFVEWASDSVNELTRKIKENEYAEIDKYIKKIKNILKFVGTYITHYTGITVGKILIIESGKMRLSEGSFLNDTSEGRQLFDYLNWHGLIKKETEALLELYSEKPFIASFVADHEHNNLTLWRMYGKELQVEGKGCAITIDKEKFIGEIKRKLGINSKESDKGIVEEGMFIFYKVAYRNNDDSFSIPGAKRAENNKLNKLLKTVKEKLELLKHEEKQERTFELITNSLNDIAYLFKTAEYQYEHEVRLVMQGIGFEKNIYKESSPPKVYIELGSILPAITKVTIGPKVDRPDEWAAAFNYSFKKENLNPTIVISRLPYK